MQATIQAPAAQVKTPTCRLVVTIPDAKGLDHTYTVTPIRHDGQLQGYRLRNTNNGKVYDVDLHFPACDCPDHTFRQAPRGGECKHVRALRACGLIQGCPVGVAGKGEYAGF